MEVSDVIAVGVPILVLLLGVIGYMLRRVLVSTDATYQIVGDIQVKQAVHDERLDKHDQKLDEYGNRIRKLEHPRVRTHPTLQGETYHP